MKKKSIKNVKPVFQHLSLQLYYSNSKRMKFELKHGGSGHSQQIAFDRIIKGEDVMQYISEMYKISPKDQLLITKLGHIIRSKELLNRVFSEDIDDKTLASGSKHANKGQNKRVYCIFLFDLKELSKPEEVYQKRQQNSWIEQLKSKLLSMNNQSSIAFPFESVSEAYPEQQIQKYERFVKRINSLKNSYIAMANQYSDLKQYCYKVQQVWDRCKNQKKAAYTLLKAVKPELAILNEKIKDTSALKQSLKSNLAIDNKSLRQNSGCFEIKKKSQNHILSFQQRLSQAQATCKKLSIRFKTDAQTLKNEYKSLDQGDIQFGQKNYNGRLQECHQYIKKDYDEILTLFSRLVQSSGSSQSKAALAMQAKLQKSEQHASSKLAGQVEQICFEVTSYYCKFNEVNEESKFKIRKLMNLYNTFVAAISNSYQNVISVEKDIKAEIQQQKQKKMQASNKQIGGLREISQSQLILDKGSLQQIQIKRRINFKKLLNAFQSYASKICVQEQSLRKKFVNQIKLGERCQYECLKNAKVPQIDFDENKSSDLELMKIISASNSIEIRQSDFSPQEFMIYSFNIVLQKIKGINANQSIKVKNLQEIIKRMSDVFSKVYNKKINDLIQEKQEETKRLSQLEQKIASLQSQVQSGKYQIIELKRKLSEKEEKLIAREKQRSQEINKEIMKSEKLSSDNKYLQKQLSKLIKVNENLYNEVLKGQQDLKQSTQQNEYLKQLLAQKELLIIEIEKNINNTQKSESQLPKIIQNDLKSAVLHNFSKDIDKSPQANKEIERLTKKLQELKQQHKELEEDYEELSSELRKIITKQTEDVDIQVTTQDPILKTLMNDGITINEEITVGQNALFMPFSNSIYVGVTHKDDDRTLCNYNNVQSNQYLLEFSDFNLKTKELLSQCSFLIVLHVTNIKRQGKNMMVNGQIRHIFGFEDDNTAVKNYVSLLPS